MSSSLKALLARIPDEALRAELAAAITEASATTEFGLVFEKHLPETVRLPHHPIRRGVKVGHRDVGGDRSVFEVTRITNGKAELVRRTNPDGRAVDRNGEAEIVTESLDNLVVVAEFGDPIYPGLKRLGSIDRGGDKPAHVVINAENHHALEMLRFTHAGKIDCIYIDPPYNKGARDWKYNNDYVDSEDEYRHSKWLAFINRRLRVAKDLLNPEDSVLIVTIDETEHLRLGLLLDQVFSGSKIQMVSSVINPGGSTRPREFSRVDEYIFFVFVGSAAIRVTKDDMLSSPTEKPPPVEWHKLIRHGGESCFRPARPGLFYPIFVDNETGQVQSVGDPLDVTTDRSTVVDPPGQIAVWPVYTNGQEATWQLSPPALRRALESGFVKSGPLRERHCTIYYLKSGKVKQIESGEIIVTGRDSRGAVQVEYAGGEKITFPKTIWNRPAHNAAIHGSTFLRQFLPGRARFPYPKSLYAVEDALRFFVGANPNAVVLDFFAGSGTTTHAVARLNRQDGGRRQSIVVTNNEVSADEAKALTDQGYRDGDPEWEALGIFEQIARPRIEAAITGLTPAGDPVRGDYRFTDEFPMSEGFEENVEFLELTYQDIGQVELDLAFNAIAPMLWLRAGAQGPVIEVSHDKSGRRKAFEWTDRYGLLFDTDRWSSFVADRPESATTSFIVTDSATTFSQISGELPGHLDCVRLYERYLTTFAINTGESP